MKQRPILFNAEMVNAILEGRKTQTRRVMNNQPCSLLGETISVQSDGVNFRWHGDLNDDTSGWFSCPQGQVGDQLWVRETFAILGNEDGCAIDWKENLVKCGGPDAARIYRASCQQRPGNYGLWSIPDDAFWKPHTDNMQYEGAWVPSIHMPRWASRITLEITDVRIERLNDISDPDASAEGCKISSLRSGDSLSDVFARLWKSIYGDESWQSNPWVWVIEFKRVEV